MKKRGRRATENERQSIYAHLGRSAHSDWIGRVSDLNKNAPPDGRNIRQGATPSNTTAWYRGNYNTFLLP